MPLNLPAGARCFIDANIFYYHYIDTPPFSEPCSDLLQRVLDGDVTGVSSPHVMAEAVHKVMLAEAASHFGLPRPGILRWLQNHPGRIGELHEFRELAEDFGRMNLTVVDLDLPTLERAAVLSRRTGLLTNDAITVALMAGAALVDLATNDADFDVVPGVTVWKPR